MTTRRRGARHLRGGRALLLVAVLATGACGGDDGGSGSPTTGAPGPTGSVEGAVKDPVVIVGLLDLTGPSGTNEDGGAALQATVDAVNRAGGLNGHPIDLEVVDTRGDAATAIAAVESAAASSPVAFIESSPATETATGDALAAAGVPVLGIGYNPGVWGGFAGEQTCASAPDAFCAKPNHFTHATTFPAVVSASALVAQSSGAEVLASAVCAEVDSCSASSPVFEATAKDLGLTTVGSTKLSSTAPDYNAACVAWMQNDVDFIRVSGVSAMAVRLMESCADQGYEGIWGVSAGTVTGDVIEQPYQLAGGLNGFPWWVDEAPVVEYRDLMEAAGLTYRQYAGPTQTGLYASIRLLQAAIADHADPAAPLDGAAALAAMYAVTDEDLGGLIVPVTFRADDLDRAQNCFWPYAKDGAGAFTNPLGGLEYQCYPANE